MTTLRLGAVGYSTRALAEAAVAFKEFSVEAIDAFADQDLLDIARCQIIDHWPDDILDCAGRASCDAWLLAGGMEHCGRIVAELAQQSLLLGPSRDQLRRLRSLRTWRQLAHEIPGLAMPASSRSASALPDGARLYKPHRGSGGLGIVDVASAIERAPPTHAVTSLDIGAPPRGYWQQRVTGRSLGITALLSDSAISLCGATESLSAADWPGPQPYIYRGSMGPLELGEAQRQIALAVGGWVRDEIGLRGWLQADFIEDAAGRLWLLEINPRWTAGMEVLHFCAPSLAASPLAGHLAAYRILPSARRSSTDSPSPGLPVKLAKAVLYAPRRLQLSRGQRVDLQSLRNWQTAPGAGRWNIADVPAIGNDEPLVIDVGRPLLTLRFTTPSQSRPWAQLRREMLTGLNHARQQIAQRFFEPG